jgi:hypothetical protein
MCTLSGFVQNVGESISDVWRKLEIAMLHPHIQHKYMLHLCLEYTLLMPLISYMGIQILSGIEAHEVFSMKYCQSYR